MFMNFARFEAKMAKDPKVAGGGGNNQADGAGGGGSAADQIAAIYKQVEKDTLEAKKKTEPAKTQKDIAKGA